ncbi:Pyruvate dehydrogenase protein X component-like [Homarus americanus]|uniref:Pyruvate dehydrogenase protein X component-like n=1 Tax=Homarus americanus TaxID=6706 RepID=A0A8J5N120_HOMAM|nr:Pyruvate dehydrogenase protein X component-like [Homarus americanus]
MVKENINQADSDHVIEQLYVLTKVVDSPEVVLANLQSLEELAEESEFVHHQSKLEPEDEPENIVMLNFSTPKSFVHKCELLHVESENLKNFAEIEPLVDDGPSVIPLESNSLHEYKYQEMRKPTLTMPLEAAVHVDPQPIDLTEELTQIQLENFCSNSQNGELKKDVLKDADVHSFHNKELKDSDENFVTVFTNINLTHSFTVVEREKALECSSRTVKLAHPFPKIPNFETITMLQVPEDTKDVKVGTLIAVMAAEGEDWKTIEIPAMDDDSISVASAPSVTDTPTVIPVADHGNYGPSVRLLLERYGLSADQVPAGGPHGRLLKGDVLQAIKEKNLQLKPLPAGMVMSFLNAGLKNNARSSTSGCQQGRTRLNFGRLGTFPPPETPKPAAATPAPPRAPISPPIIGVSEDGYDDIEVTNMRKTIAKRLTQSKSGIAHSYGTLECCLHNLLGLRKQFKKEGMNISVNDFIIKAVAVALTRCPEMNCTWQGNQLVIANQADISIAVATPLGLITPIVHGADTLGIEDIATKVRDLAARARENKLKLDEFQGGTFTISNLGMLGIREFSAIINPPQCGILAVGGSRLSVDESGSPVTYMSATLSYDRAGIDDNIAAIFLDTLKQLLEDPTTMILGTNTSVNHPLAALL